MNTLNTLMTLTFFAPMALMVATDLLTARSNGPTAVAFKARRVSIVPRPTHKTRAVTTNQPRYLEAA